jgi:hypothetical protein
MVRPVERGYRPHGVPWVYHCTDPAHPNDAHHHCDAIPRLDDMSPEQAAIIRALLAAAPPATPDRAA